MNNATAIESATYVSDCAAYVPKACLRAVLEDMFDQRQPYETALGANTRHADLCGGFMPTPVGVVYAHGPLPEAMKKGIPLVINALDGIQDEALKQVVNGNPLVIPENDHEVIYPEPGFQLLMATAPLSSAPAFYAVFEAFMRH